MKKILLSLVAMFAIVGMASAKMINVTSGSLLPLKKSGAKLFVVYDYTNETLDKKSVKDWIAADKDHTMEKLEAERKSAEPYFAEWMNEGSKNLKVVENKDEADYIMTVHAGNFNRGNAAAAFFFGGLGGGSADVSGTCAITKVDGTPVAEFTYNEIPIDGDDSKKSIREWGYIFLGVWFDKAINKAK